MLPQPLSLFRYMAKLKAPNNNKLRDFFVPQVDYKIIIAGKIGRCV